MTKKQPNSGSRWRRWDPHIHAPGTVLNDQFGGPDALEKYLAALEATQPVIEALGVTDYYNLETYKIVADAKAKGRLPNCSLVFPNVELRLGVGTHRGAWINIHLLVDPTDKDHVKETERFLSKLTFNAFEDSFACTTDDLIKLGEKAGAQKGNRKALLEKGTEQFKVSFDGLKAEYTKSQWARDNIIVAIASGSTDGTSGLREGADATIRQEEERFGDVIFASSPAQRTFWLGQGSVTPEVLRERYGGQKPCMHGCDAHSHDKIGETDQDRYTWIKGDPTFDSLRQACIDPESRAYVGTTPPITGVPSQVITKVTINDAQWCTTPEILLNPELVAIIGARGSGKTALADIIAVGCDAMTSGDGGQSFLRRASEHLGDASVTVEWGNGASQTRWLDGREEEDAILFPSVRYLSQQFVEELCSSDGMTDELVAEIERVFFEAHPLSDRDGAGKFQELLNFRADRFRQSRAREEQSILTLSDRISSEFEKLSLLSGYKSQADEKKKVIVRQQADRATLVVKGNEARVTRLEALTTAAETVRGYVRGYNLREQQLIALQDEVNDIRRNQAPEQLRDMQDRYAGIGFKPEIWNQFSLQFAGPVDEALSTKLKETQTNITKWKGTAPTSIDPAKSLIADDAKLDTIPLSTIETEIKRLETAISADRAVALRFATLSKKITEENDALQRLNEKITDAEGARERIKSIKSERDACYIRVIDAIISEQQVLTDLYAPIKTRLAAGGPTLAKMDFTVERVVDVNVWAEQGEQLFDLRKAGPFKGRGSLKDLATGRLRNAWQNGDAAEVSAAIIEFQSNYLSGLVDQATVPKGGTQEYRTWLRKFAKWLYGTNHITLKYNIRYDQVDIRSHSPGTRGIVLLLLYLALDEADDRPLIIDQPEENLDPKSIYDELRGHFKTAKSKRQVIIVTHNANLVVNTDAEQIIVAESSPRKTDGLPNISYNSGGLEDFTTREAACSILEGGQTAFKERARRLRVGLCK